jgi:hypothetical protein
MAAGGEARQGEDFASLFIFFALAWLGWVRRNLGLWNMISKVALFLSYRPQSFVSRRAGNRKAKSPSDDTC